QIQIFQLCLDRVQSESVRKRCIQIDGFRSNLELLVSRHAVQCPHIVKTVCQLDEDHSYVIRQREEHLAEVFRLLRSTIFKYTANLRKPVDDTGYFRTEDALDIFKFDVGILHNIMKEC